MGEHPSLISATVAGVWGRRRTLALAVFATALAGTLTLAAALPGVYRATATVLVERQDMPGAFARAAITGDLEARLHRIGQEILSRARLAMLMDHFDLYPELRSAGALEAAVDRMRRDIQVELKGVVEPVAGRGTTVAFTVSFRGRDPEAVARVANAVTSFYVEENVKIRERQAADAAKTLNDQLEEAQQKLRDQERRINAFKWRHLGQLPEQVTSNLSTLTQLNTQLGINNSSQTRVLERRDALSRRLDGGGTSAEAKGEEAPGARLARLKQDLIRMRKLFSDKYPDVVALEAEIAALELPAAGADGTPPEHTIAGIRKSLTDLDAEMSALKDEEKRLRRDLVTYQRRIEAAPERDLELQEMSRDYRTTQELYDTTLKRVQAESMERRRTGEEFRILDPAVTPRQPVAPNRLRMVLVGLMLALGGATVAVVLAEHIDTSFHTLDDLRAFTKVPVLASVPRIVRATDTARQARQRWLAAALITLGLVLIVVVLHRLAAGNYFLVEALLRGAS